MLVQIGENHIGPIVERRSQALGAPVDLDFIVVPIDDTEDHLERVENAVVQPPHSHVESADPTLSVKVDEDLVWVALAFRRLFAQGTRKWDTVASVFERESAAGKDLFARVAQPSPTAR